MPGEWPPGTEYVSPSLTFDLTASMARAAGVQPPAGRAFDGVDILRHVAIAEPPPARCLFWRQRRGEGTWRAIRDGTLKFLSKTRGSSVEEFPFDLHADRAEETNLLGARPDDVRRLKSLLTEREQEVRPVR